MKTQTIVNELLEVAKSLGVEVRFERGNFRGGRCSLGGQDLIMLNRRHLPEVHLSVLASVLREMPIESVYMKPAVRKALEDAWMPEPSLEVDDGDGA